MKEIKTNKTVARRNLFIQISLQTGDRMPNIASCLYDQIQLAIDNK